MSCHRRNENGFATVTFLALLPLLLTALAVMASSYLIMKSDGMTRHICRVSLLNSQEKIAEKLNELIALNKKASSLRKKRKFAEAALWAAPDPTSKAAARVRLQMIMAEQAVLAVEQKRLFVSALSSSKASPLKASDDIKTSVFRLRALHADDRIRLEFKASVKSGKFDVIQMPKDSPTPDFIPSPDFSVSQLMQVDWTFALEPTLSETLRPFARATGLKIKANCAATIVKGVRKWQATLKTADKRLLK